MTPTSGIATHVPTMTIQLKSLNQPAKIAANVGMRRRSQMLCSSSQKMNDIPCVRPRSSLSDALPLSSGDDVSEGVRCAVCLIVVFRFFRGPTVTALPPAVAHEGRDYRPVRDVLPSFRRWAAFFSASGWLRHPLGILGHQCYR